MADPSPDTLKHKWLPWHALLRFAVIRLGLSPDVFWRLSLGELRCLLTQENALPNTAPKRLDFEALMALFPDQ